MKSMQPATLLLGALAICFGTLAISGSSKAQLLKNPSTSLKTATLQNQLEQQSQSGGSGSIKGSVSHFEVDETFAWAVVGTTIFRINRTDGGVTMIPLPSSQSQPLPPLIENPIKSGIRNVIRPPGGGGG